MGGEEDVKTPLRALPHTHIIICIFDRNLESPECSLVLAGAVGRRSANNHVHNTEEEPSEVVVGNLDAHF